MLARLGRFAAAHPWRYVAAWVSLGRACLDRRLPRDAATALHEALELDPHNPVAWRLLGEARLGDGDRFGALDAMEHALQLAPGDEVLRAAVASLSSETWPPAAVMAAILAATSGSPGEANGKRSMMTALRASPTTSTPCQKLEVARSTAFGVARKSRISVDRGEAP